MSLPRVKSENGYRDCCTFFSSAVSALRMSVSASDVLRLPHNYTPSNTFISFVCSLCVCCKASVRIRRGCCEGRVSGADALCLLLCELLCNSCVCVLYGHINVLCVCECVCAEDTLHIPMHHSSIQRRVSSAVLCIRACLFVQQQRIHTPSMAHLRCRVQCRVSLHLHRSGVAVSAAVLRVQHCILPPKQHTHLPFTVCRGCNVEFCGAI